MEICMSKEEYKNFFNKYNTVELESINKMFKYTYSEENKQIIKVLEEVYNKKDKKEKSIDNTYKIKLLTEKELLFLYELIYNTLITLSCIKNPNSEEEVDKSSGLLTLVEYEIEKRRNNERVKVLSLNKKN